MRGIPLHPGLPAAYRRRGLLAHKSGADALPKIGGASAVLAGSCSAATLGLSASVIGCPLTRTSVKFDEKVGASTPSAPAGAG